MKVEYVYDGDTAFFLSPNNTKIKVRLRCIDAPEKDYPEWGNS